MFQIDEKVLSDNRTLVTIQGRKTQIDPLNKNGTIHYVMTDHSMWLTTPKIKEAYLNKDPNVANYFDRFILAKNGTNIDGNFQFDSDITFNENVNIKKDLVIKGNLTVEGDSSIIDTPRLSIEDNIIELNRNEIGFGVSLKHSGTAINRGTSGFARWLYNEDSKAFILDTNPNIDGLTSEDKWALKCYTENNDIYKPGEVRAKYKFTAPFGNFTDTLTVGKDSLLNNLLANGTTKLKGVTTVDGEFTANGVVTTNSTTNINGSLIASKLATFKDNVTLEKVLSVLGTSSFVGLSTFQNGLTVSSRGANITGDSLFNNNLTVSNNLIVNKDATINATASILNLLVRETATIKDLSLTNNGTVEKDLLIKNNLTVNALTNLKGATSLSSTLSVSGESSFNNHTRVTGNFTISKTGGTTNGNLNVAGSTSLAGATTISNTLSISGAMTSTSSITTSSDITAANVVTKGKLTIQTGNSNGIYFADDNCRINQVFDPYALPGANTGNLEFHIKGGVDRGYIFKNNGVTLATISGNGNVYAQRDFYAGNSIVLKRANEGHRADAQDASGINADKLDNLHAESFIRRDCDSNTPFSINFAGTKAIKFGLAEIFKDDSNFVTVKVNNATNDGFRVVSENNIELFKVKDHNTDGLVYKNNKVWHKGNHGHGSTLDADTIDGKHAVDFSVSTHNHDDRYIKNNEVNLKGKYRIEYNDSADSLDFIYIGDII